MPTRVSEAGNKVFMTADAVGGVWTYALELARGLARRGVSINLAVLGPGPSEAQRADAARIPKLDVITTGLPLDWTARDGAELDWAIQTLKAMATAAKARLVHLHAPALVGAARWRQPLIVTAHSCVKTWWRALRQGPLPADLAWRAERTARGLAVADEVIAPTHSFARALTAAYGDARPIHVVHNGRRAAPVRSVATRDGVLTAGRLWDPAKNIAVIDKAASLLQAPIHAAGPTSGPCGERIDLSNVELLGDLTEATLADWCARTAIFVSLSKYEPFGLSVLEAANAGAALVLSDIPTFRELWNGAAWFVPADDAAALAHALAALLRDAPRREDFARCAGRRAKRYSVDGMVTATARIHEEACQTRARRIDARRSDVASFSEYEY